MPKKIPAHAVVVVRNGKIVTAEPNKLFDFTEDEVADVERLMGADSLRDPINEVGEPEAKGRAKRAQDL